jgi:hypothetical protein
MRILGIVALGLGMLASSGCWNRFTRELVPLSDTGEPDRIVGAFARRLPDPLHVVNTATFEFGWQSLVVLGVTRVDAAQGTFAVVGLLPAGGVKLFEVAGDRESVRHSFAQPQLLERGDLPSAVAADTRRIYLDLVPSREATWSLDEGAFRSRQPAGAGELQYVFAGEEGALVEKSYREKEREIWTIQYADYREQGGDLYPATIVLEHHEYEYRLTLHLKEILS